MLRQIALFSFSVISAFGQVALSGGDRGPKAFLAVPMIGAGTWDDPKRPAFVRESGVPFRFTVSDDGTMAIVEASPRTLAEMAKLESLAKNEARAKIFRPERDKQSDALSHFKTLKKDFDPAAFTKPVDSLPVVIGK